MLYYWLAALAYKLLGISETAARLPSALAGLAGCLALFQVGRHWLSFRCGLVAAFILAASPLYFSLARAASPDMLLASLLILAFSSLYFALFRKRSAGPAASDEERQSLPDRVLGFYGFLALAVLAKGPIGVVLAAASLLLFGLFAGQLALFRQIQFLRGSLLWAAVALPWYLLCYRANGWVFIQEFLINHNLARFVTDRFQHSQPFWFYLPVLFGGFFPWVFQLPQALWHWSKGGWRAFRTDPVTLYLCAWAAVPFLVFSISHSKLPGYILPMLPPLALLVAREWERVWQAAQLDSQGRWFQRAALAQAAFVLALGLALPLAADHLNIQLSGFVLPLTTLLCGVGGAAFLLARQHQWQTLLGVYLVGVGLVIALILYRIIPELDALESSRQLAAVLKKESYSGEPIFIYKLSRRVEYGLNFYLDTESKIIYSESDLQYPPRGFFFLLTTPETDVGAVLPHASTASQWEFNAQKIVKLKRAAVAH